MTYWSESPRDEADFVSVTIGSLHGDDQRMLEDLDLLPGSSEDEDDDDDEEEEEPESEEGVDDEVPASRDPVPASSTATAAPPSSSVVVPTLGSEPLLTRSTRHGTMSGIPWFEEMIEGSRLGRVMKGRRGMGVSDDDSTKIQWEVSEWHDDGTGGAVRQMQSSSSYSRDSSGKRKRGSRAELGEGSSRQKRT